MGTDADYRIEHDTMGEVRVPASALYGAQTQRAVENFPISGTGLEPAQIVALARIKRAAAHRERRARHRSTRRSPTRSSPPPTRSSPASHHDQFPVDTYQTGSGTSSNMNMNEVLATLATDEARRRPCTRTTTSTPRSRRTTCSPPRCTSP